MGQPCRADVCDKDLRGLKYFRLVGPLLERLQSDATARDKAGNRQLFFDQDAGSLLLTSFSPSAPTDFAPQTTWRNDWIGQAVNQETNFLLGNFGTVSFGYTRRIRQGLGWDDQVDYNSTAYHIGSWTRSSKGSPECKEAATDEHR